MKRKTAVFLAKRIKIIEEMIKEIKKVIKVE